MESSNRIKVNSTIPLPEIYSFEEAHLKPEILSAVHEQSLILKPVHQHTLLSLLQQKNLLIISPSGLGRGSSTILAFLNLIDPSIPFPQVLVLSPTHNLAQEYLKDLKALSVHLRVSSVLCVGKTQIELSSLRSQVIVGTCGKILYFLKRNKIQLRYLKIFICDVANELFREQVQSDTQTILRLVSGSCVNWYLASKDKNEVKEKFQQNVENGVIVEISFDNSFFEALKFFYKIVESDKKGQKTVERIINDTALQTILFSYDGKQLAVYLQTLKRYGAKLLSYNHPITLQDQLLQDFEKEVFNILVCENKGSFLRRLKTRKAVNVIFLDLPRDESIFKLRLQRFNFNIDDKVFFILSNSEEPQLEFYTAKFDLKLTLY